MQLAEVCEEVIQTLNIVNILICKNKILNCNKVTDQSVISLYLGIYSIENVGINVLI
jgi:hypothetical protein